MTDQKKNILIFVFIWFLACSLGIYLRLYTLRNNVPHDVEEQATFRVVQNLRKTVNEQIEKSYPTLSLVEKQRVAKDQFNKTLHNEKQKVREAIDKAAKQISQNIPHDQNPVYLLASDSYYYYNLTENIITTGKISDKTQGSKYFNRLMNAPHGFWEPLRLYPYIGYAVYKIVSVFNPGIRLMEAVSYTPLFLTVFIVLFFLLGCRILGCSAGASFLGAIYLLCAPIFLRRSMFGWYDDDPPNIFFLFAILTVFFYGLKNLHRRKIFITCGVVCAVLFTLYALFWQGWVFLASIVGGSAFFILLYNHFILRKQKLTSTLFLYSSLIFAGLFLGVGLVFGPKEIFTLFKEGWVALQDFIDPQLSLWPDLYIAVGELLAPTTEQWFQMMGGIFFIAGASCGLLFRCFQLFKKPDDPQNFSTLLLVPFALIGTKLSFGAQRFETLCLIPFAFAFPIGLQSLWHIYKKFKIPRMAQYLILILLFVALTIIPLRTAQSMTPELLNKIFNSTWDTALSKVEKKTPSDSIINTWWPPGHFIKAMAHRRVTFDGATINKPQSYWIATALLATDEREAAGIFRMLNISGNDATDYLLNQGFALSQAVLIIKSIMALDEPQSRRALAQILKKDQMDHLLSLTHGKAPPSYVLLYNDMAEESLQFSFVANWNFNKVEKINKNPDLLKAVPKHGSKQFIPFLWKIAGGPPKYTPVLLPVAEKGTAIIFENNILIDREAMTCTINSAKYGRGIPQSILYEVNGEFLEKKLPNATLPFTVLLINDRTGPVCMLAEPSLANSLLLRLYHYGGNGLNIFKPLVDERDATQRTKILVYKIDWTKL